MTSSSRPTWAPTRLRDLIGTEIETKIELTNGLMTIPAGTRATIDSATAWHKLHLVGAACGCCGVRPRIARVHIGDVRKPNERPCP